MTTLADIGRATLGESSALRPNQPASKAPQARRSIAHPNVTRRDLLVALANGPLTRPQLAEALDLTGSPFTKLLQNAAQYGDIEQTRDGPYHQRLTWLTDQGRAKLDSHYARSPQQAHQPVVAPAAAVPAPTPAEDPARTGGGDPAPNPTPAAGAGLSQVGRSPTDPAPVTRHCLLDAARDALNDYLEVLRAQDLRLNRLMLIYELARDDA